MPLNRVVGKTEGEKKKTKVLGLISLERSRVLSLYTDSVTEDEERRTPR